MLRRTKIVATVGPASNQPDVLRALIQAGVDVLRINFSHVDKAFAETIKLARAIAADLNRPLGIMADLQGPKIRISRFKDNSITLNSGQSFILDCQSKELGDESWVGVDYQSLCKEISENDHLLLDDGLIELEVKKIEGPLIHCVVVEGGVLSNNKGLNRKGGGLSAGAITDKDKKDMAAAVAAGIDYITLSFVRDAHDILTTKELLANLGVKDLPIIAKIERTEALAHLNEIISAADVIMVARGDLGVEVGAAEVPAIQKHIIEQTRSLNKIVITATQMMESMIIHPQPTRAEVSDVANAILDGTDAVMLSAETAKGAYPVKVINMVDKICVSAEKHASLFYQTKNIDAGASKRADQAIAMATMHVANHFPIKAIIALTESGVTPIWMSRFPSTVPIYAITENEETVRKLSLVNNVFPLYFDYSQIDSQNINQEIIRYILKKGLVEPDTYILLTRGTVIGQPGGTNSMEIVRITDL
ncbi:pyruvate kinase (plasmid) [Legionella adelaidensis]|uniref:Pyruvate kinase n=1 Tax=Legionella adelaidensis TaxID=45056 RepID=A0A0W0R0S7_9GAMM|nr:pyruvate kinase [Legionella adelaidensis]KTC64679.1 pyruvate kinase II [Legionella adelaidensis]VEH86147.1 pyruvate kinase [Legionella adelaidensis]